jgi:hypothetical protein
VHVPITGESMKVHPSHTDELAPAAKAQRSARMVAGTVAEPTRSFASVHAKAVSATTTATAATGGTSTGGTSTGGATAGGTVQGAEVKAIKLGRNEKMEAVAGHAYAEITAGKRDGMFVNTTNNARRGKAFVLVHKHGTEYHIYGTGKDRVVVALKRKSPDATGTPPATTGTTPITGAKTPTVTGTGATGAPIS